MAQSSFPFENIDTTETQYSQLFRTLNNGVNGTPDGGELEVDAAGAGLAVDVAAGQAMVRGHFYISTEIETRALATADSTDDRIDTIVLRLDPVANNVLLAVKTGVPDPAPVAPTLVQTDGGIFEQPLANVLVPANAGVPSTITDRREFMGTKLGTWTTAGRPVPAGRVLFGYNTTLEYVEYYDPIAEDWEPVAPPINELNDIGDVDITTPVDGDLLVYDDGDWVNKVPSGSILQVVQTVKTDAFQTSSTSFVEVTGLNAVITPSSSSSKILIVAQVEGGPPSGGACHIQLSGGNTATYIGDAAGSRTRASTSIRDDGNTFGRTNSFSSTIVFLDAPNTTSATTYKVEVRTNTGTLQINRSDTNTDTAQYARVASSITVMEVAG
jgi:hypothetical protein